jgi:hypothetical protein
VTGRPEDAQVARIRAQIAADLQVLRRRAGQCGAGRWMVAVAVLAGVLAGAWAGRRQDPGCARRRGV